MDKNSIIGFILIFFILIGFSFLQSKKARQAAELQAVQDSIELARKIEAGVLPQAADSLDTDALAEEAAAVYKDSLLNLYAVGSDSLVTLSNDRLSIDFSTRGAQPQSVLVKNYYNYDSTALYLFRPGGARFDVSLFTSEQISTSDFIFQIAEKTDTSVAFRLPFSTGGYIEQRYSLKEGSYNVSNTLSFVGMENTIPRNVSSFDYDCFVTIPRMEKGFKNESQYSKLDFYYEGEKKPVEIGRGQSASKPIESRLSWFAFQQQFFSAIVHAPGQFSSGEVGVAFYPEKNPEHNLMDCSASMRVEFTPASVVSVPFELYFGPNDFTELKSYGRKYEKIIPLGGWLVGWFTRYVIIPLFDFLHRFISNFGIIILLMTIVIKIVVFPFMYKSLASSAKMQALRPEIEKINARYPHADNQQEQLKKQQATMNLYRRAGVNPMGGCLPTLLTFPILWAMFRFFPASIELRQQPFLWCHDLSTYDSILDYGTRIPILGDHLSLFALLMAVTMWVYSKIMMKSQPTASDPTAASMNFMTLWMMPIMMFFICNNVSAALSYYYLLSQLISIAQMVIIRKSIDPEKVLAKVRESEGKPLPKSKWQLRLEEAQKMQQEQLRKQQKRK